MSFFRTTLTQAELNKLNDEVNRKLDEGRREWYQVPTIAKRDDLVSEVLKDKNSEFCNLRSLRKNSAK